MHAAPRLDLFTLIHKGLRAMLFDIATDAARIDVSSSIAVDLLLERIRRAIAFLDEHAALEDAHVFPAVRAASSSLVLSLEFDHFALHAAQTEVEMCAEALAAAPPEDRRPIGGQLVRLLNRLIIQHLAHMGREESEVNELLWRTHGDEELAVVRARLVASIPPARHEEWMAMIAPALDPVERRLITPARSAAA